MPQQTEEDQQAATAEMLEYAECMRDHGITNFPDPKPGEGINVDAGTLGIDPNSPQFRAANDACMQGPNGETPETSKQDASGS